MDWLEVLKQIFELIIYPVLGLVGVYLTYLLNIKINEVKQKAKDDKTQKYFDLLDEVVYTVVRATTQAYVDSLKQKGTFTDEEQKTAFKRTYDAIMSILPAEAKKVLTGLVGDFETFVISKIEAVVGSTKNTK